MEAVFFLSVDTSVEDGQQARCELDARDSHLCVIGCAFTGQVVKLVRVRNRVL